MESSALILSLLRISLVGLALVFSSYVLRPPTIRQNLNHTVRMETIRETWNQYTVGYYLFAILFLIFDVETVFVFPWATVMREVGMTGFVEILIFFAILGLGLFTDGKHALKWE